MGAPKPAAADIIQHGFHASKVEFGAPGELDGFEIEIESGIKFQMIPIDLDYAHLVIALEVNLAEVIFIDERTRAASGMRLGKMGAGWGWVRASRLTPS